jgi:diguanylate cyclase (GGDEF)-like protein
LHQEDVLSHRRSTSEIRRRVRALNARSQAASQSNPRAALRLAEEAASLAGEDDAFGELADAKLNAAWASLNLAHYDAALAAATAARDACVRTGDVEGISRATNALGVISARIGEFEHARELFEESLRLADSVPAAGRRIASLNNLGELAATLGEYRGALEYYERAYALATDREHEAVRTVIEVNLGRINVELGNVDDAGSRLSDALDHAVLVGDRIAEAEALTQLGRAVFRANGRADPDGEAESLHLSSIEICEELDHPAGVVAALEHLGELLIAAGRLDEAEEHAAHAVAIARETATQATVMGLLEALTAAHEAAGDVAQAYRVGKWLHDLYRERSGADTARKVRTLQAGHELDQARMEAEIVRLRNVELREKTDELEQRNRTLQLMYRIGSELTSTLELEEIARRLHDRVNELMSADVFGFAFYRETDRTLDFALVIEDNQRITPFSVPIDSEESFGSWVIRNRDELVIGDADREYRRYVTRRKRFTEGRSGTIVYLPLSVEERMIGVLTVQSHRKHAYGDEQLAALRLLAPYFAVALDNSCRLQTVRELNTRLARDKSELERAYERIEHLANHDLLTQLPNRRLLGELIHEHIPLARRQSRLFAVVYVDIDDFKPINDTFGHDAGDQVLARIADRLREAVRQSDTVARIGGDEFVLVLRDVGGVEDARAIAQKVLVALSRPMAFGDHVCALAASIGVSLFPEHGETYDELISAADRAMYRSKQAGKSSVSVAASGDYRSRTSTAEKSMESPSKTNRPST